MFSLNISVCFEVPVGDLEIHVMHILPYPIEYIMLEIFLRLGDCQIFNLPNFDLPSVLPGLLCRKSQIAPNNIAVTFKAAPVCFSIFISDE